MKDVRQDHYFHDASNSLSHTASLGLHVTIKGIGRKTFHNFCERNTARQIFTVLVDIWRVLIRRFYLSISWKKGGYIAGNLILI